MTGRGVTAVCGAVAALGLAVGAERAAAIEPGNFGQTIPGGTVGAVIAAPTPPGVYIVNDNIVAPDLVGVGPRAIPPGATPLRPALGPTASGVRSARAGPKSGNA